MPPMTVPRSNWRLSRGNPGAAGDLTRARILAPEDIRTDEAHLGSRVRVTNLSTGRELTLKLVSP